MTFYFLYSLKSLNKNDPSLGSHLQTIFFTNRFFMSASCMPYGVNVSAKIYEQLQNFYNDTDDGCCGIMQTIGKWILVVPAHLITGLVAVPLLMCYDLAMVCLFALGNLFTAFTMQGMRDRFCGHFVSLFHLPNESRNHAVACLFTPIAYHGNRVLVERAAREVLNVPTTSYFL